MNQPLHLIFDLDDTLIHCNVYFDRVIDRFVDYLEHWFANVSLSRAEIKCKQQEFDIAGIHIQGFTVERFPLSLVETYEYYCDAYGRLSQHEEHQMLLQLGYTVYDSEFELYPNVVRTLTRLTKKGHILSLYTGGDQTIQMNKVNKVNLTPFFEDRIFVKRHKNYQAMNSILNEQCYNRDHTWMIGNSQKTDILPAIECNIGAIYVPPISSWVFDQLDVPDIKGPRVLHAPSINKIPQVLHEYHFNSRSAAL
jgi:putative hydrolase of the HAD superfamily